MSDTGQASVLGQWARYYASEKKWAVVPVHRVIPIAFPTGVRRACSCRDEDCPTPGKHAAIVLSEPLISNDFEPGGRVEADGLWAEERNIGVVCGSMSGMVAFNVQVGVGEDSWRRLMESEVEGDIGGVGTLTITTGGGGRIMLYASAPGLVIDANRLELDGYPGVSVLGDGAHVILPPSQHANGTPYGWDRGASAESDLMELPPGLLVKLQEEGALSALPGSGLSGHVDNDSPYIPKRVARTLSDLGNARRLVDHYGGYLAYTPGLGWRGWIKDRWTERLVEEGYVRQCAESLPKIIADERKVAESKRSLKSPDEMTAQEKTNADIIERRIKSLRAHEMASRADGKINSAVRRAASDPRVLRAPETWDRDPFLMGVPNGMIDLETGELLAMDRSKYISRYGNITYEADASRRSKCPEFWNFIDFITMGDEEYAEFLQHWAGYSLTGSMREKALVFCQGPGNTGKTTFADAMLGITGDYGLTVDNRLVSKEDRSGNIETSTTMLIGRRFAVAPDIPTNDFNSDFLKKISGGDTLTGRRMQQNQISFVTPAKLWIFSNHYPNVRDKQLMERFRVLPFHNQSTDKNRTRSMWTKPETWTEGIGGVGANAVMRAMLDWAVQGARKNIALGTMPTCAVAEKAKAEYEMTGDIFMPFVRERCRQADGVSIDLFTLYTAYDAWNSETRFSPRSPSRSTFKNIVAERGFTVETIDGAEIVRNLTVMPVALPDYLRRAGT